MYIVQPLTISAVHTHIYIVYIYLYIVSGQLFAVAYHGVNDLILANKVSRATKGQLFAVAYHSLGPCHTHGIHGDRPSFFGSHRDS